MKDIDIKSISQFLFILFLNVLAIMSFIGGIHHFLMSVGVIK